jgi:hypothetical protein
MEETVIISREEYERLVLAENKLNSLEVAGVDNWAGYDEAKQYREELQNFKTNKDITRFEIIDHSGEMYDGRGNINKGKGRNFIFFDPKKQVHLSLQDSGRTLKVFINDREEK